MQLRTMLATGLLCASVSSAHADTSFAAGSIIIPATASFQTDCGAVSMYGFVYNVLRANPWLQANGFGTIEVNYAIKDPKGSPNRCIPTDTMTAPAPSADPKWLDGCDFEVFSSNPATPPVKLITNATAQIVANDVTGAAFPTLATTDATHTDPNNPRSTYPNWPSVTITAGAVTRVRYSGGAFVVNDQDAVVLRRLISGNLIAQDAVTGGNNIDFTNYKSGACSFGSSPGGKVNLHVAQVAFTAPVPKVLSAKPPRLALLGWNGTNDAAAKTGRIDDGILQAYLNLAGLNFTGAQGCAISGYLATTNTANSCVDRNGVGVVCSSLCPFPNKTGQIYDLLDFRDLLGTSVTNKLAALDGGGLPLYKMFWSPHWGLKGLPGGANVDEKQALDNIVSFANTKSGLMAECASIATFEGTDNVANGSFSSDSYAPSQFQTCTSAGCATTSRGFSTNSSGSFPNSTLRNCTDPNITNGASCAYFAESADAFVQIGDYRINANRGGSRVGDFKPNGGAAYKAGVKTLVTGIGSVNIGQLGTPAQARSIPGLNLEFVTRNFKDNDTNKSNILYLGIHDQSTSVSGAKIVLQTLLLLGDDPPPATTKEVTRSSPIVATINAETDIVQGTFEKISPAPPSKNATTDLDAPNFEFPYLLGHMRAIRAAQVSVGGVEFNALGGTAVAFDAAVNIPAATAAGCGTNFAGSCRTVFTHTTAGVRPPRVFFTTGAAAVKALVAPTLNATNQNIVISRVLAGQPDGVGGFLPKLGGVDRSTVAVVGPSLLAGSATRPQMIYFGASDGMVHAVCAQAVAATGCTTAGRELWAFIPRTQLPNLAKNLAVINGSPRFADLFGDFDPTDGVTARSFKTVLLIPSGSGDPGVAGEQPSVTALDITDPFNPTILWEYTTPASRGVTDFGQSIELTTGSVVVGAAQKVLAFVHSNNGGTGLAGSVVTALDIETGLKFWQTGHEFGGLSGAASPAPRLAATVPVPAAGIPGAALAIDRTGAVAATDIVYATLYGDVWRLDAKTGVNAYGGAPGNPMFRFNADLKPIGATPAIFSDTPGSPTALFIAVVSGGYFDPVALSLWSGPQHHIVAFSVNTLAANIPLTEASAGLLKFKNDLAPGERGFAQPTVIGDQLFVTSDTTDVNSAAFGLTTDTGHLYKMDLSNGGNVSTTIINGGAGSVAHSGTTVYAASGSQIEEVGFGANTATANATSSYGTAKVARKLWLATL